ncbi:dephospho-CoA kinase [Edaphobacter sp. 12200R-103]|jgi:dephospho-CoA kinase|uniref:dephospho-CoA kinase n=1 Tax=Edaphobacter sp. 12200R-103 TaxID=2703788 RepID=UPI00138D1506|nr:dephospho-CoA kinase [Edaphobacter sp. 12200R-103]QHS52917.1 dephospho-CoA kinase [Edaphobacter sp. 12200R-103]
MLRVGLTGSLGSGKSTVARLFAIRGAHILEADAIGREMMQPGQPVYDAIVQHFGDGVLLADGQLDRPALARISFEQGRVEELNSIVHPAVIARQAELAEEIFNRDPNAVVIVESALIFETRYSETNPAEPNVAAATPWKARFDCILLVTAPEEVKIERYLQRISGGTPLSSKRRAQLSADARSRLAQQIPDEQKIPLCDFVIHNDGYFEALQEQVDELWPLLKFASKNIHRHGRPASQP